MMFQWFPAEAMMMMMMMMMMMVFVDTKKGGLVFATTLARVVVVGGRGGLPKSSSSSSSFWREVRAYRRATETLTHYMTQSLSHSLYIYPNNKTLIQTLNPKH
jgi:hypothetical protein